jgi:hypothetical protein
MLQLHTNIAQYVIKNLFFKKQFIIIKKIIHKLLQYGIYGRCNMNAFKIWESQIVLVSSPYVAEQHYKGPTLHTVPAGQR